MARSSALRQSRTEPSYDHGIPAVPEFSMPPSSSSSTAAIPSVASTSSSTIPPLAPTPSGRFKIVFKGGQRDSSPPLPVSLTEAPATTSPLPHPPSPSAPASTLSSSASPAPESVIAAGGEGEEVSTPKEKRRKGTGSGGTKNGKDGLNRVCHHHKSLSKGELRMTCRNNPECKTIWCKSCIEKYYIECLPSHLFTPDSTFVCPVCLDSCKCAGCRRRRKEIAREARRASSLAASSNSTTTGTSIKMEVEPESVLEKVKVEDSIEVDGSGAPGESDRAVSSVDHASTPPPPLSTSLSTSSIPVTLPVAVDPTLSLPSNSTVDMAQQPPPPPPPTKILKIRVKPPKRPRTENGTFLPKADLLHSHQSPSLDQHMASSSTSSTYPPQTSTTWESTVAYNPSNAYDEYSTVPTSTPTRGGRGRGRGRGRGSRGGGGRGGNRRTSTGESGPSFFGRPPKSNSVNATGSISTTYSPMEPPTMTIPRPKRTKKVSTQYEDYAVEGVPNFVVPGASNTLSEYGENGSGGEQTPGVVGGGGRGGRRRYNSRRWSQTVGEVSTPQTPGEVGFAGQACVEDTTGKRRRRPRLSGLSSASSCSELSSSGEGDDDDVESYWMEQEEMEQRERESDQRVRHWLLVPPSEPQPVLAGLERNLSEGGGEEMVGFTASPTDKLDEISLDHEGEEKPKKEKVRWIEGPERRRRRAMALQKAKEEAEGSASPAVETAEKKEVEEDRTVLQRTRSLDIDVNEKMKSPCDPIKPFGNGSPSPRLARKLSLPSDPTSAPSPSSLAPVHSDQPPPYESHFPPPTSAHPLRTPSIVVSPVAASPRPTPASLIAPASPASTVPSTQPLSAASTSISSAADLEADLASRSADDKRLGLRLLDAIRTITGTKLAMEAMGISPAAVPTFSACSSSTPSPIPSPSPSPAPSVIASTPAPVVLTVPSSPVKISSTDDAETEPSLSLLSISHENAEYEAQRRQERERLLETRLDPDKVFRTEAKGNDAHLLERNTDWEGMDVDQDDIELAARTCPLGGGGTESFFDFESFSAPSKMDDLVWISTTSTTTSTTMTTTTTCSSSPSPSTVPTPTTETLSPTSTSRPHPSIHLSTQTDEQSLLPTSTPTKLLTTSSSSSLLPHFLAPHFGSDEQDLWMNGGGGGGAATPTRGLMELDFDFQL